MIKKSLKILKISYLILSIGFIFGFQVQYTFAEVRDVDIVTNVAPQNPKPFQDVNITLESYATDLNKALIEWSGSGKVFFKSVGATDFSFKTGAIGTQSVIDIKIRTVEGDILQKRIVLVPGDMDMLWQATDSYVPPFYKGKALPAREGAIKIIAVPSGSDGIQSNNTFTWKLNDKTQLEQSGYKKNSFSFNLSLDEKEDFVEVSSSAATGNNQSNGDLTLSGTSPIILFYKKSPDEGILYNNTFKKEVNMNTDEMTIVSVPYFISDEDNSSTNIYSWKINGGDIDTPPKRNELTVRPTAKGGYAEINLEIENTLKLFQKVAQKLTINL